MRQAFVAVLACVGCASTNPQPRVASLDGSATPSRSDSVSGNEPIGTTVVLTVVGGAATAGGATMLVCAGGGLGCFSGASYPSWAHSPKIEQVVLATTGAVVFAAGAAALVMVPMWLAISGSSSK